MSQDNDNLSFTFRRKPSDGLDLQLRAEDLFGFIIFKEFTKPTRDVPLFFLI